MAIFHDPITDERPDPTAADRARHKEKIKEAIKENIADIVAEESIIGQSGDKVFKVPIRGIKEYRFVYGDDAGVGQGSGNEERGDVVEKGGVQDELGRQGAGNQKGAEYYETEITLEELTDILFDDLMLPNMLKRRLKEVESKRDVVFKGVRKKGIMVRLDKKRTVVEKLKRKAAQGRMEDEEFSFTEDDLRFRKRTERMRKHSNAVVFCVMDTSGSMNNTKKFLARSFFFLLYKFLELKYQNIQVVFIAHTTEAKELSEVEFFTKGEDGGTYLSSGQNKVLEVVHERYDPSAWNIYVFHASDGDNFVNDNERSIRSMKELCQIANLVGFCEIDLAEDAFYYSGSSKILHLYHNALASCPNFSTAVIKNKFDIYNAFRKVIKNDKTKGAEEVYA